MLGRSFLSIKYRAHFSEITEWERPTKSVVVRLKATERNFLKKANGAIIIKKLADFLLSMPNKSLSQLKCI